jgi:hypothetical protein
MYEQATLVRRRPIHIVCNELGPYVQPRAEKSSQVDYGTYGNGCSSYVWRTPTLDYSICYTYRGPKVTSLVACSSRGKCAQHLRRIRGCDAHPACPAWIWRIHVCHANVTRNILRAPAAWWYPPLELGEVHTNGERPRLTIYSTDQK